MEPGDYSILEQIEGGRHVFRPLDDKRETRQAFQAIVQQLLHLRAIGLIRLEDNRVLKAEDGSYDWAGPCYLTPAGVVALSNHRVREQHRQP